MKEKNARNVVRLFRRKSQERTSKIPFLIFNDMTPINNQIIIIYTFQS